MDHEVLLDRRSVWQAPFVDFCQAIRPGVSLSYSSFLGQFLRLPVPIAPPKPFGFLCLCAPFGEFVNSVATVPGSQLRVPGPTVTGMMTCLRPPHA